MIRSMRNSFIGVTCLERKPVVKICISQNCRISPFLCQGLYPCSCQSQHLGNCVVKSLEELDKSIEQILKFENFIVYSPEFKGQSIHVAGRYAVQTRPPVINQRFALTQNPLPLNSTQTIKGCVGVGIFVKQVLKRNEYKYVPDPQFMSHGSYMLLSNSMLYSNHDQNENGTSISKFCLKQKDVIKVKYSPGKVTFISNFLEESLTIETTIYQQLHFGVYLYDVEDEIQIVNTFVTGQE